MSSTFIPAVWSAGSFEANPPFDQVVKPEIFYVVEAVRTIPEMQALKLDLFKMVFEPVGVQDTEYQGLLDTALAQEAVVVTLTSRGRPPVYVLSNYLKSFPLVDGVIYEHLCIIADLGAVPPALKDKVQSVQDHFNEYIKNAMGIPDARVTLGTIPTRGYTSKEEAESWEITRQSAITENPSDVYRLEQALAENRAQAAYIKELEDQLKANAGP